MATKPTDIESRVLKYIRDAVSNAKYDINNLSDDIKHGTFTATNAHEIVSRLERAETLIEIARRMKLHETFPTEYAAAIKGEYA